LLLVVSACPTIGRAIRFTKQQPVERFRIGKNAMQQRRVPGSAEYRVHKREAHAASLLIGVHRHALANLRCSLLRAALSPHTVG
jgi:hypothetical protein